MDQEVQHLFRFKNVGTRDLTISSPKTSCSACSAVVLDKSTVAPGESGVARVSFRPLEFGNVGYHVMLKTNDPLRKDF